MNWKNKTGRDLLREAYPEGQLHVRGIVTVGGYTSIGPSLLEDWSRWIHPRIDYGETCDRRDQILAAGDLLPWPEPSDDANWAILKADLCRAAWGALGWTDPKIPAGLKFTGPFQTTEWTGREHFGKKVKGAMHWSLTDGGGWGHGVNFFGIDTDDPAEALVRARIMVQQRASEEE